MSKVVKIVIIIVIVFFFAAVAGIAGDKFLFPWLSSFESLQNNPWIKRANEGVTIIEKTEKITVKEDFSVTKTSENVLPSVVSIIAFQKDVAQAGSISTIKSSQDIKINAKTGIIITSDGLIVSALGNLTQADVNSQKNQYKILMTDGKELDAKLQAIDPYSKLAFYRVEASNLPAVPFGNSDELLNGEKIVLSGNASGEFQYTFSLGIIREKDKTFSLLNSELSSSELMEGAFITDAIIDEKNVGGPMIDFNGTMVGLINQVDKDGKMTGFVMPVSTVREAVDRMAREGKIERPRLGVYHLSINREISLLNSLPVDQGALVYSFSGQQGLAVLTGSPADRAGIKIGDIITEVNGEKVDLNSPLSKLIAKNKKGDEAKLKILRNGQEQMLSAILD